MEQYLLHKHDKDIDNGECESIYMKTKTKKIHARIYWGQGKSLKEC